MLNKYPKLFFALLLLSLLAVTILFYIIGNGGEDDLQQHAQPITITASPLPYNTPTPCANCKLGQAHKKPDKHNESRKSMNKAMGFHIQIKNYNADEASDDSQVENDIASGKPSTYNTLTSQDEKTTYLDELSMQISVPVSFYVELFSEETDADLKQKILQMAIQDNDTQAIIELIKMAITTDQPHDVRIEALSNIDDIPKDVLKPYLNDSDPEIKELIEDALADK